RLEVLKIRSALSAEEPPDSHDILERGLPPFRAPHHTVSYAGLVGGGSPPRPGEITLAHRGVLFLDELPEFQRQSLEALRQPLELGSVHIRRSDSSLEFPAAFQLITAMNPCPCGYLGHPSRPCSDTPQQIQRYRARISGPLLDRIDIHLQLLPVHAEELLDPHEPEDPLNPRLQRRVAELRRVQRERNGGRLNTELEENELRRPDHLTGGARRLLILTCRGGRLSARGITRVLRVARSLADLAEAPSIQEEQLAAALHYRVR
ncbi:MAG: ATP-binding protein, partial [Planctomycetota bacterium]